jgi:hypothetical protein
VDPDGNVVFCDQGNNVIRLIATKTADALFSGRALNVGDIYTVAGNTQQGYAGGGSPASEAELNAPNGLAVDASGNLLVSDGQNNVVRLVAASAGDTLLGSETLVPGDIYTVFGNNQQGYSGDGGPAALAQLYGPSGIVVRHGSVYFYDTGNHVIREVFPPS